MNAIITGSRAYGIPRQNSDVDLVIMCDKSTSDILRSLSDEPCEGSAGSQIRFGRLNIIDTQDPVEYAAWVLGTARLQDVSPVTRDTAAGFLKALTQGQVKPHITKEDKGLTDGPELPERWAADGLRILTEVERLRKDRHKAQ